MDKLLKHKYELYLASLLVLIFGDILSPSLSSGWHHLLIIQNVLVGSLLFYQIDKEILIIVMLFSIILIGECLYLYWFSPKNVRLFTGVIFIIYFLLASGKLYRDVLNTKEIRSEMLAAAFSGFIMIAVLGGFLFTIIEIVEPNSFSNLPSSDSKFKDLNYLSFISILTIGYGDILPVTYIAKKAAILLGLAGNFYMTFITAVVVGKFINQKNIKKT